MIKLLTIGDIHFSGTGPAAYRGNYKADILDLLAECTELAEKHECAAVLIPGDLTHSHIMSTAVLTEFIEALKKFPCPVLTVAGNHDRETTNLEDLKAAPYGLLRAAGIIRDVSENHYVINNHYYAVAIAGYPYRETTDVRMDDYHMPGKYSKRFCTVSLVHGMLLPEEPYWAKNNPDAMKFTTLKQLEEGIPEKMRPNIIVCGHYHDGLSAVYVGKTLVVNYGAICRLTRGLNEINRVLQVGLITIESPGKYWAKPITLESQRPGHEVLDREELVREIERNKNRERMSRYLELLGTNRELRTRDVREVISQAVKELGLPEMVKERCFARLDKVAKQMEAEE